MNFNTSKSWLVTVIFIITFINIAYASCPSGMVSYWTFDSQDISGSTVNDTFGSNHASPLLKNVALQSMGAVAYGNPGDYYPASRANDGDISSSANWWTNYQNFDSTDVLQVNLSKPYEVSKIVFRNSGTDSNAGVTYFDVQYWNGSSWVNVPNRNDSGVYYDGDLTVTFDPVTSDKFRITNFVLMAGKNCARMREFEIYARDNLNITVGKVNDALSFNGVDDYVSAPDDNSLDGLNAITISAWVKPYSLPAVGSYWGIVTKFGSADSLKSYSFALKNANGVGRLHFNLHNNAGSYVLYDAVSTQVNVSGWNHIVVVWDGSAIKTWLNNIQDSAVASFTGVMDSTASDLFIGGTNGYTQYFNGLIDEVAIFNRALNSSEIQQLYQNGLSGNGYCGSGSNAAIKPNYTTFSSSETTNFSALSDLTNVTMPVLATSDAKIEWAGSGYNADGKDFDTAITISHNFVSVDVSKLDNTFNRSANITLKTVTYPSLYAYEILRNGQPCGAPECVKISANPVKFKVSHFSNYTTNGTGIVPEFNSSLIIVLLVFTVLFTVLYKAKN